MLTFSFWLYQLLGIPRYLPSSSEELKFQILLPLMAKKMEMSAFLFFNILNVFLPGSLEFLPLTCRYVVQRSFKYLRCLYLQIFGAPLLWFPPYITPHFSISSHPGNLKVFFFLTLQAKKIVLYCLSSSYPTACRQDNALRKKAT